MMKLYLPFIVLLLLISSARVKGQTGFSDSFIDSNFTANPAWIGETNKFEINAAKELQLNNTTATSNNETYLTTTSTVINDAFWEFYIRLDFSPSSSNFAKVYLTSDNADLTAPLNGYYVKVGGQSGTVDDVRLYRQDGTADTLLIDGIDGTVASSPAVKVRVTKSATNEWNLFLDQSGVGNAYQLQGLATESKYGTSSYFGVLCDYTSTRSDKFFFDDFVVSGVAFQDTVKPLLTQVSVVNDRKIEISFNEKLDSSSALNLTNYSVNNGIGNPSSVRFTTIDSTTVELNFATPFTNGNQYEVSVQNVADKASNVMLSASQNFTYFVPVPADSRDIVINELYPDFSPSNGLPEAEFVELYNASNKVFDLGGWVLSDGTTNAVLGTHILRPGDYIILCSQAVVRDFQAFGTAQGLSGFPTLNNSGDNVTLSDDGGSLIDFVNYTDDWYQSAAKKDGGFTLEQINPFTDCIGASNFIVSNAGVGGTPGTQNSVFDTRPDTAPPSLLQVLIVSDSVLSIRFNEAMDSSSIANGTYSFSPNIQVESAIATAPSFEVATLNLDTKLDSGIIYTFSIAGVSDCSGNLISTQNTEQLALPATAIANDLIINEILFNPRSGSFDFVEVYNRSEKVISLQNWQIAKLGQVNGKDTITNLEIITETPRLLFPKEYLVLTEDKADVIQQYPLSVSDNILEIVDLPSYDDADGTVYLFNSQLTLIDEVKYEDDYHFALLVDDDGVSLERINSEKSSLDETNWHSASEKVGFATPGYKNSQDFTNPRVSGAVSLDPEIISPDGDGFQDILSINYQFNSPGFAANVSIFDRSGRLIKKLVNNELLGGEGTFYWDGITEDNTKARIGIYIVLFEAFNLNGDKEVFKEVITVGSELK